MTQHPNHILAALLHKKDRRMVRDLALFTPALAGQLSNRLDLLAERLNEPEEIETRMMRRDLP